MATPEDGSAELLPALDFPGTRRMVRRLYCVALGIFVLVAMTFLFMDTDEVVLARAVVAPAGETARVQSTYPGTVKEILVHEGTAVMRGQVLVRLDDQQLRARIRLLEGLKAEAASRAGSLEAMLSARALAAGLQDRIRQAATEEVAARLRAAQALLLARERESVARARDAQQAARLLEHQFVASVEAENSALGADVAQAQVEAAHAAAGELEASLKRLGLEKAHSEYDARMASLSDQAALSDARAEVRRLQGELDDAELEVSRLEIVAPRAGTVQDLTVFDQGDVVQAGSTVALVVPADDELIIYADVPSAGVAFLRDGQRVHVKLDAYPFQEFGVLQGEVIRIAADTTARHEEARASALYRVHVRVPVPAYSRTGMPLRLRPGMTGLTEFVVRRVRLGRALLRPLRGLTDSIHH